MENRERGAYINRDLLRFKRKLDEFSKQFSLLLDEYGSLSTGADISMWITKVTTLMKSLQSDVKETIIYIERR